MLGALDSFPLGNCCCDGGGQINLINVTLVFYPILIQWRSADQSDRRDFLYSIPLQSQPIVPPWSSQAVLKLEQKSSQVGEHLNREIITYCHPHHHDRHIASHLHDSQSQDNDYQIPNVLMESPEEMEEVLADLRRNAEARAKTMARYQYFLTYEI